MIKANTGRRMLPAAGQCPSEELLASLLDDGCTAPQQAALIAHLDVCESCRGRIETAAGEIAVWSAARGSLQAEKVGGPGLDRVTTALKHSGHSTHDTRPLATETAIDFLQPCDKPGCIGRLGDYEIRSLTGRGGMGFVFMAFDPKLSRIVALKVLASPLAMNDKARQRFQREARSAASVKSEHVVAIHAVEHTGAVAYLVMEHVAGNSLGDHIRWHAPLSWSEIVRIGAEIADGLQAAHAIGLVHRDIKPDNILLEAASGRVKITDFGLARAIDDTSLTHHGCVAGTPEFMAPEQAAGGSISPRTDLFSLGSLLYAMCTGEAPFAADSTLVVLRRTQEESPRSIQAIRADVPADLVAVITKLMQKDPLARFDNASQAAAALRAVDLDRPADANILLNHPISFEPPMPFTESRRTRYSVAVAVVASLLLVSASITASELSGVSHMFAAASAAMGLAPSDEEAEPEAAGELEASVEQPTRIQIVTPDSLLQERNRLAKDRIELTPSPNLIRTMSGHTGPVKGLAYSADGEIAVSGSGWPEGDGTLRLWSVKTAKMVRQFDMSKIPLNPEQSGDREAPGQVTSVDLSSDNKLVVAGITGGAVGLWDVASGEMIRHFVGHTGSIHDVAISPDGTRVLSCSRDSTIRLWDLASGDELLRIPSTKGWVRSVSFSPNGTMCVSGHYDHAMRVFDLASGQLLDEADYKQWVWDAQFSPNGARIASVAGPAVIVRDLTEQKDILRMNHAGGATCVAYSNDGTRLLTGGYDNLIRLWDANTGELLDTLVGHRGWVWEVAFSADGRTALSAGGGRYTPNQGINAGIDNSLRLWELPKKEPLVVQPQ